MKITLDIPDSDIEALNNWASVSRTLNTAKRMCEVVCFEAENKSIQEEANHCYLELKTIEPLLDRLHREVRNQRWNNINV